MDVPGLPRGHPLTITKPDPMEEPMRIHGLEWITIPKVAVPPTGLAIWSSQ